MENNLELIKEAKRIEEDSVYSAKSHFNAADFWSTIHLSCGCIMVALSIISAALAFSSLSSHIAIGILSVIAAILAGIITLIDPQSKFSFHCKAGNKYKALSNDARIYYNTDIAILNNDEKRLEILKSLNSRRNKLNLESPQIPCWAFRSAKDGIENGENKYSADNME